MENKNPTAAALRSIDGEDVTTWALPENAIARLGRGKGGDMAFSPDGKYFAVGTSVGLWLYELPTLSPIALWDTERGMTGHVGFSPDSQRIVTRTFSETVKVWDVQSGVCITQIEKPDKRQISYPAFSQDGQHIATISKGRDSRFYIWCSHTGEKVRETEIQMSHEVYPLCFSPDLSMLAGKNSARNNIGRNIGDSDSITVWHVETGEQIANITEYPDRVRRFCFSPCGRFLAAGSWHGTIHVWNVESGQLERTYADYGESQMYSYFLPGGELITAAVSERKVEIWRVEKSEKLGEFEHRWSSGTVHFSDSGTQLAFAGESEIKIWTKGRSTAQALPTIQGHAGTVGSFVFTSDEKTLVTAYWGRNTLLWDVSSQGAQRPTREEFPDRIRDVYPTSSGKILAVGGDENILEVCEFGNSEPLAKITIPEPGVSPLTGTDALALTGQRLARAGRDRNIYVWEYTPLSNELDESGSWEKCATLIGHPEYIRALALSPDGKRLASISITRPQRRQERTILLWDVDTEKQIAQLPPTVLERGGYRSYDAGIAFSPDGDLIAGGFCKEIVLWDATGGKTVMTIPQSDENQRPITLCFSPCGRYLAAGAWWKGGLKKTSICLWEVATGKKITTFWGHTTDVQCFAFSQDNTLLVSGGHDGAIYLWDMKPYL